MRFIGGGIGPEARRVMGHYWRIAEVKPWHIIFPMVLAIGVSLAEGGSLSVLIPLSDRVAAGSFDPLSDSRWVGWVTPFFAGSIDSPFSRDATIALALIGLLFGGQFLKLGLEYGRAWFLSGRDERYLACVREETFGRILGFGRQYFDRNALGHVDTEVSWSTSLVEFLSAVEGLVMDLLRLLVKVGLVIVISLPLSLSLLVSLSLTHLLHRKMAFAAAHLAEEAAEIQREIRFEVLDLLGTIPLVKAYAQEEQARGAFGKILGTSEGIEVRRRRLAHFHHPVEEGIILFFAFLAEGLILAFGSGSAGENLARFCAFFLVSQQCVPDLKAITKFRLIILDQLPKLRALGDLFLEKDKFAVLSGSRPFAGVQEKIELRGLHFSFRTGSEVLRGVDAVIPAGRVTGLVGASGAGKSSLAELLARLHDTDPGSILVDGVDIRDFELKSLRRKLAIVSQEVWLLNRSIRENLIFGLRDTPSDEELWSVLADVGLAELVREQIDGLNTGIGDKGARLSGGQRQRVALARTLLRNPEILILDEATAALDSTTELQVMEAVGRRLRGRTVLVIAHRLSTLKGADQILVMESGRIVERGTWLELVAAGGPFSVLYQDQFRETGVADEGSPA